MNQYIIEIEYLIEKEKGEVQGGPLRGSDLYRRPERWGEPSHQRQQDVSRPGLKVVLLRLKRWKLGGGRNQVFKVHDRLGRLQYERK